ncbi:hypothetical protein E4U54_001667 [Claviceps lovelessii]|nr:hypothetical protein E4U54_001667 [Claviceps lovelessii]
MVGRLDRLAIQQGYVGGDHRRSFGGASSRSEDCPKIVVDFCGSDSDSGEQRTDDGNEYVWELTELTDWLGVFRAR